MRRRDFIAGLAGAAAWPLAAQAQAQRPRMPVVGLLNAVSFEGPYAGAVAAIRQGLQEAGFADGRDLAIEYRTTDGHYERFAELAADLVARRAEVIVALGASKEALTAVKAAAATVPILFANGPDAAEVGLVKSPDEEDRAATPGLASKRLELLLEMRRPRLIGYLDNSTSSAAFERNVEDVTATAGVRGRELVVFDAANAEDVETAFAVMALRRVRALIVSADPFLATRQEQIVALASVSRIPSVYAARSAVELGGLMSYGVLDSEMYRLAGVYAGRILKGEIPAEQLVPATRFEMVINNRTAKALRIPVPRELQLRAEFVG